MMKHIFIIKDKLDAIKVDINIEKYAIESFNFKQSRTYNSVIGDAQTLEKEFEKIAHDEFYILFVLYNRDGKIYSKQEEIKKGEIEKILLGRANMFEQKATNCKINIKYKIEKAVTDKRVIANVLDNIELDLSEDYCGKSYILISKVNKLESDVVDLLANISPKYEEITQ